MPEQAAELESATRLASEAYAEEAEQEGVQRTMVLDAEAAARNLLKQDADEARSSQQQAAKRAAKKARQKQRKQVRYAL